MSFHRYKLHMNPSGTLNLSFYQPGGVYASIEVCTTRERRFEGIGTAIFLSLCLARAACTASVCTSGHSHISVINRYR